MNIMRVSNTAAKHPFVLLAFFLLLLFGGRLVWYNHYTLPEHPAAERGVLDLRHLDIEHSGMMALHGDWAFYPEKLLAPDADPEALDEAGPPVYLKVPGEWRSALPDSGSSYGYGTYRLRILVDGSLEQPYEFWFDYVQSASKVWVNGKLLATSGMPADSRKAYTPDSRPFMIAYDAEGQRELDVQVQVSNFDDPTKGGLLQFVRFGPQAAIDTEWWYQIGFQLVAFLIFMLHGLYALILFAINPREKTLLTFFLLMVSAGASVISSTNRIILLWLPLTYTGWYKFTYTIYLLLPFLMLSLVLRLLDKRDRSRLFRIYRGVVAAYIVFIAVSPTRVLHSFGFVYSLLYLLPIAVIFGLLARRTRRKDSADVFLLLAAASVASSVVWALFQTRGFAPTDYYPLDMIAALIGFAAYWFKRYFGNAEENERLNERLRLDDKRKDEFLAHTAHELRTPLHGMVSIAHSVLGKERRSMDERSAEELELMLTIGRRMSHVINDLLDVARLQDKRIVLQPERQALQSVVPGVFSMLGHLVERKPVELRMAIPDSFPPVRADEKRLVQILLNLLHNAIKFTEAGTISVTAEALGATAAVRVSDTGSGMDEATRERAFLAYERGADGVGGIGGGGIGLGLTIVKELVELHGGSVDLRSEPGRGTDATFTLPLYADSDEAARARTEAAAAAEARTDEFGVAADLRRFGGMGARAVKGTVAAGMSSSAGMPAAADLTERPAQSTQPAQPTQSAEELPHVLLVDDDPVNLKVLSSILPAEEYRVGSAMSGEEALAMLGMADWDLVVIDVMMPRMSGYELTRAIRSRYTASALPILLLTARGEPADVYVGFDAGANDYVIKPADSKELRHRVRSLTSMKRSAQESLRMEAAYLQAQIRPHFLFNTLNALMTLSDIDSERMRQLGEAFSSFLRISFDFLNSERKVPLAHELELIRAYLYIEKERFGERLHVAWSVDERLERELALPPLTVQPLVENAVRHGLLASASGGTIRLDIRRLDDGSVRIEIGDDGIGMDARTAESLLDGARRAGGGIGLINTDRRLRQAYGQGLAIASAPGEGTRVSFIVPRERQSYT